MPLVLRLAVVAMLIASLPAQTALPAGKAKVPDEKELRIYMPYSDNKDHMVIGREIRGYHMRYDLAQQSGIFMVLLPVGYESLARTPVYFAIDTLSLDGGSLENLYNNDLQGIVKGEPGTRIVRRDLGSDLSQAGTCLGAELRYPEERRAFPWERFFICKSRSKRYAIMMSLGARTEKDLTKHYRAFVTWADAPQVVSDQRVVTRP